MFNTASSENPPRTKLENWSDKAESLCIVEQIMAKKVVSVALQAQLPKICSLMYRNDIHRVFVTDDKRLVGVITTSDILRIIVQQSQLSLHLTQ